MVPLPVPGRNWLARRAAARHSDPAMHDIKAIRADPAAFDAGLARRGDEAQRLGRLVRAIDTDLRQTQTDLQNYLAQRNELSRAMGAAIASKDEVGVISLRAQVAHLKDAIPEREARERVLGEEINGVLATLPNLPAPDVPDGLDETAQRRRPHPRHPARLRLRGQGARRPRPALRLRPRCRRRHRRGALRRPEGAARPPAPRARAVPARCERRRRVDRGGAAAARPAAGDVRHRAAAEVRRGRLRHDRRALPDPDRRGVADQPRSAGACSTPTTCRCASPP